MLKMLEREISRGRRVTSHGSSDPITYAKESDDDVLETLLERGAGARSHRVHTVDGLRGARFRGSVHWRGWEHQGDLVGDQQPARCGQQFRKLSCPNPPKCGRLLPAALFFPDQLRLTIAALGKARCSNSSRRSLASVQAGQ